MSPINYLGPEGDGTLLHNCLLAHLEKDLPGACQKFKLWKEETLNLLRNFSLFREKWINLVLQKLSEKRSRLDSPTIFEPSDIKGFAWSHWKAMLDLYILSSFYKGPPRMVESEWKRSFSLDHYDLRLIDVENHAYALSYSNHGEIAAGSKEWLTDLQDFHQHFGQDLFVEEVFNCLGSWDPSSEIKVLADDAYEQLDMVCLGGIVFKPGHCMVCRQLVT